MPQVPRGGSVRCPSPWPCIRGAVAVCWRGAVARCRGAMPVVRVAVAGCQGAVTGCPGAPWPVVGVAVAGSRGGRGRVWGALPAVWPPAGAAGAPWEPAPGFRGNSREEPGSSSGRKAAAARREPRASPAEQAPDTLSVQPSGGRPAAPAPSAAPLPPGLGACGLGPGLPWLPCSNRVPRPSGGKPCTPPSRGLLQERTGCPVRVSVSVCPGRRPPTSLLWARCQCPAAREGSREQTPPCAPCMSFLLPELGDRQL